MTRLQTQAEANAYWETVEVKKWVVTFTAGSRNKRRNAESLVTSRTASGARKAAIRHQQTECGNDWVTSAMSTVRLAVAQDLGCVAVVLASSNAKKQPTAAREGWKWMCHPSRNEGNPIPVRMFNNDGVEYYQPFDLDATEFEWNERDAEWVEHFSPATPAAPGDIHLKGDRT